MIFQPVDCFLGLSIQCYLITNNMACTLLLPQQYTGRVEGLALGDGPNARNTDQYCSNCTSPPRSHSLHDRPFSSSDSVTPVIDRSTFTRNELRQWLNNSASPSYRAFINSNACPMDRSLATFDFCVQDTILSQSPILGQITTQSSIDYHVANRFLGTIMPIFAVPLVLICF